MSQADDLIANPTSEVRAMMAEVEQLSEASGSLASTDLRQDDGSVLTIASFQGADAELHVSTEGIVTDDDGVVLEHAVAVTVPLPRLNNSPPPQGVGDDGVLRDEDGNEVTQEESV